MKKLWILSIILMSGLSVYADSMEVEQISDMTHFWKSNGMQEQKIIEVGTKIINANKLDKRIPLRVDKNTKIINATSNLIDKRVTIYSGLLPYIDNDDELAAVLSHEIAHSLDAYGGIMKWMAMGINSKQYETKADLVGIDLMVKAGYNPIAAITGDNKWMGESPYDFGILMSHPKTSSRLFEMYKYIYKKYPLALDSDMTKNVNYQNFLYSAEKDIRVFTQNEKERTNSKESNIDL